jgi:hypothetical protein
VTCEGFPSRFGNGTAAINVLNGIVEALICILSLCGYRSRYDDGLRAGRLAFDSQQGQGIFLYCTASRQALGPTLRSFAGGGGLNRQRREADHSAPSSAEVKRGGAIPPLRRTSSWRDA